MLIGAFFTHSGVPSLMSSPLVDHEVVLVLELGARARRPHIPTAGAVSISNRGPKHPLGKWQCWGQEHDTLEAFDPVLQDGFAHVRILHQHTLAKLRWSERFGIFKISILRSALACFRTGCSFC